MLALMYLNKKQKKYNQKYIDEKSYEKTFVFDFELDKCVVW